MARITVRLRHVSVALTMFIASGGPASAQVTFDWATIGNLCNPPDPLNEDVFPNIGTVCHEYRIAKYWVTNAQYVAFLNAVADADPNSLYSTVMETDTRGGVIRSGSAGAYTYSVKTDRPGRDGDAVVFVSFPDAMRFVNWLENGQPSGPQDVNTTEAGAYPVFAGQDEQRVLGATFFLPSDHEWYKAAFHQPSESGGDADDYWFWASMSNVNPPSAPPVANYYGLYFLQLHYEWTEFTTCFRRACPGYWEVPLDCGVDLITLCSGARRARSSRSDSVQGFNQPFENGFIGFRIASRAETADLDLDLDVDLRDFQRFQNRMGGPK